MRILLDTHVFLWMITGDERLREPVRGAILDSGNTVYLSPVSVWEALVKWQIGKLPLPESPGILLPAQRVYHNVDELPLSESSVLQLLKLPGLHRDPYDRMLICQALAHDMVLATADSQIMQYTVPVLQV